MPFAIDQLKLAFAYSIVEEIVDAGEEVDDAERKYLAETFPATSLASCGFLDENGKLNDDYRAAVEESLETLSGALALDDKFALVDIFMGASLADGEFHHEEGNVMVWAARLLGITSDQLDSHLDTIDEVGSVDLPTAEFEDFEME